MTEIARKIASQSVHSHDRCVSFVETKEMKELKQSKKFFKIYSKWFNNLYAPSNFMSDYDIKYHLEHLTSKMSHFSGHIYKDNSNTNLDQNIITTNFKEEIYLNYKTLERMKIEVITSYVSPKSKKNAYYTNKIDKFKSYVNFWNIYRLHKELQENR